MPVYAPELVYHVVDGAYPRFSVRVSLKHGGMFVMSIKAEKAWKCPHGGQCGSWLSKAAKDKLTHRGDIGGKMRRGARSTSVPQLLVVLYALAASTPGAGAEASSAPIAHVPGDISNVRRRQDTATTRLFEAGEAVLSALLCFSCLCCGSARGQSTNPLVESKKRSLHSRGVCLPVVSREPSGSSNWPALFCMSYV